MLINPLLVLSLLITATTVTAQSGILDYGDARGISLGYMSTSLKGIHGLYTNPASIGDIMSLQVSLSAESRFEGSGILQSNLALAGSLKQIGSLGLTLRNVGVESFNATEAKIHYAYTLWPNIHLGLALSGRQIRINEYGTANAINATIGIQTQVSETLILSAALNDILNQPLGDEDTVLKMSLGIRYQVNTLLVLYGEIKKEIEYSEQISIGMVYAFYKDVELLAGFQSNPGSYHMGVSTLLIDKIHITVGTAYHQILGFSPSLGIASTFN